MAIIEHERFDPDALKPGQGIARFLDGHEEFIEYFKHRPNGIIFYTGSGKYIYITRDKTFYRLAWEVVGYSYVGKPEYEENMIPVNDKIASILYKERDYD